MDVIHFVFVFGLPSQGFLRHLASHIVCVLRVGICFYFYFDLPHTLVNDSPDEKTENRRSRCPFSPRCPSLRLRLASPPSAFLYLLLFLFFVRLNMGSAKTVNAASCARALQKNNLF